jgi:hypothetical protein
MYINYAFAVGLTMLAHLIMTDGFQVPIKTQMAILLPAAVLLVLAFFSTSRALFLALDLKWDPPKPEDYEPKGGFEQELPSKAD